MRLISRIALSVLLSVSVASFAQDSTKVVKSSKSKVTKTKVTKTKAPKVDAGLKKYGNVAFADPQNHKYPIDNAAHTRGSWRAIQLESHAAKYKPEELAAMKQRIHDAGVAQGVKFKDDKPKTPRSKSKSTPK